MEKDHQEFLSKIIYNIISLMNDKLSGKCTVLSLLIVCLFFIQGREKRERTILLTIGTLCDLPKIFLSFSRRGFLHLKSA